jgi:hypothetical protein
LHDGAEGRSRTSAANGNVMDALRWIAEHRIEDAMAEGDFDNLPQRGYIDCKLSGEQFLADWFAQKIQREEDCS